MVPKRIGRYQVLAPLATGGMAEVLLCALRGPSRFERLVVIKRILPQLASNPQLVEMFVDEARNLGRVAHPNVVQVHEFGHDEGELFLAMEYVDGENLATLSRRLASEGESLDPALAAFVAAEACAGLHAAHELIGEGSAPLGIVHRDVSPQNLIVTYDGHVKVLDFGIALAADRDTRTDSGSVKGKLEYMSPEQLRGDPLDRRSDIFSLGIVLHELITGQRLYGRAGHGPVVEAITHEPALPPSRIVERCPRALDDACLRALEKTPEARYASAAEMRRDLLEAGRDLVDPSAVLATTMKRLFAERIAKKAALLASLREGAVFPESVDANTALTVRFIVADADADGARAVVAPTAASGSSEHPTAYGPTLSVTTKGTLVSGGVATTRSDEKRLLGPLGRRVAVILAAMGVVGIVLATVAMTRRSSAARPASPASAIVADAGAREIDAGAPGVVVIAIKTNPAGARVLVGGEAKGDTPTELTFPRGNVPITIQLERPGSESLTQAITPDRDQSFVLALSPAPRSRTPGRPPRPAAQPRASASAFWRFE